MNRKYTRQIFLETCHRLRKIAPDFTFTTDVIVGFPGETEEDHLETLAVIEEIGFAKVHMFPYSPRKRTRAALYPNQIPQDVIQRRKREVLQKANETAFHKRESYVGHKLQVLTEGHEGKGHTANFLPVEIESPFPPRNTLLEVEIIANTPAALIGKVV